MKIEAGWRLERELNGFMELHGEYLAGSRKYFDWKHIVVNICFNLLTIFRNAD